MGTRRMSEVAELWLVWAVRGERRNGLEIGVDGTLDWSEDNLGEVLTSDEEYDAMQGAVWLGEL